MKLDITSEKIQFHLTRDDFESSFSELFNMFFVGFSFITIILCFGYLVSEWSFHIYDSSIILLMLPLVTLIGTIFICEGIFPFVGELIITIDTERLCIIRKIFSISYKQCFMTKDIIEVGQLYFCGMYSDAENDVPPILFKKCFVIINGKQNFFATCVKQENKDLIITEINEFILKEKQ